MNKRLIVPIVLGVLVGLASFARAESRYQGKPASTWVKQFTQAKSNERHQALTALVQLGPDEPGVVDALVEASKDQNAVDRVEVVSGLCQFISRDKTALQAVMSLLKDKNFHVRQTVLVGLGNTKGKERVVVPALIEALQDRELRVAVAVTLSKFRTFEAESALRNALQDKDGRFRLAAAQSLDKMITCKRSFLAIPYYEAALKDENPAVRQEALSLVVSSIAPGAHLDGLLIEMLADKDASVRWAVVNGLATRTGPETAALLAKALTHADPLLRQEAAVLLTRFGDKGKSAVPALTAALKDADATVRYRSAIALAEVDREEARKAISILEEALNSRDRSVAVSAAAGLWRIDKRTKDTVRVLSAAMFVPDYSRLPKPATADAISVQVVGTLASMGPAAKEALPQLVAALGYRPRGCRSPRDAFTIGVRAALVAQGETAVPNLVEALTSDDQNVRTGAFEVLAAMGPAAKAAVPALREAAQDKDIAYSTVAKQTLKAIDPNATGNASAK